MFFIFMPTFGLLKVSGPDAQKFLQGQVTCNVEEVTPTQSRLGAHCNPQGRVLFLFRLFLFQDAYYLLMPLDMLALALSYLRKYAVFYKLSLSVSEEDLPELTALAAAEWQYFDLSLGRPQIYPETSGKFLPHDLNLHQLEGISWEKGCYTGQEIIARMHYRGKLKNHLYRARIQTSTPPRPGAELKGSQNSLIVDCREESPEVYQLLVVASENEAGSAVFALNPSQNETWEWL